VPQTLECGGGHDNLPLPITIFSHIIQTQCNLVLQVLRQIPVEGFFAGMGKSSLIQAKFKWSTFLFQSSTTSNASHYHCQHGVEWIFQDWQVRFEFDLFADETCLGLLVDGEDALLVSLFTFLLTHRVSHRFSQKKLLHP